MTSLKKILDAIDMIHSDCFMVTDDYGGSNYAYVQAIARRMDDGMWQLEHKGEQQTYSVASGKDLAPPEILDFDTLLKKMTVFNDGCSHHHTITAPMRGTHFETVKTLIKSNAAGRMKAIQKLRRRSGPGPG